MVESKSNRTKDGKRQEIRNKTGFKKWSRSEKNEKLLKGAKGGFSSGYGEEWNCWEEGTQEKWFQEEKKQRKKRWEKWDQETGDEQKRDGEKKGRMKKGEKRKSKWKDDTKNKRKGKNG